MTREKTVLSLKLTDEIPPLGMNATFAFYDDEGDRFVTKRVYIPRPAQTIAEGLARIETEAIATTGRKPYPPPQSRAEAVQNYLIEEVEDSGPIPHIKVRLPRSW